MDANSGIMLGVLICVLIALVILFFVKLGVAEFRTDDSRNKLVRAKYLFENNRLTFKNLKKECPGVTNVEYHKIKMQIQEGKILDI